MIFFRFQPIYQERIWGGRAFERFGRDCLPKHGNIGERWDICDREDANSRVSGGPMEGYTLRELIRHHADEIMGPGWHPERRFPILVKWLDSRERLSLQVHPPRRIADIYGGEPKTETWYVADATPEAGLYCGLKRGVTREMFESALRRNAACELVHRVPVAKGDSLHVESGRLHAIDAGCLILEIQQNSDTTYRVYDWGRHRALHIDESLRCIDFEDFEPSPNRVSPGVGVLTECEHYRIRYVDIRRGGSFSHPVGDPEIFSLVAGSLCVRGSHDIVETGENLLLPASAPLVFEAETDTRLLITDGFA